MKRYYIFFFSSLMLPCVAATTIEVAEIKEHYSSFITKLRDKVQDFLKSKEVEMMVDVQELRRENLANEGDYFEMIDQTAYENMAAKFDDSFEHIDREFNAGMRRLDDMDAPDKVKQAFVKALKLNAASTENALIQHYRGIDPNANSVEQQKG